MTGSEDVAALAARLERLETAEAARAALYRYAEGADARDWSLLASAFDENAVLEMPDLRVEGRDAVVQSLRSMLPAPFVTQHLMTNPQVTRIAPGRARLVATVYYLHEGAGFEARGWGRYDDEVVVRDGVGLITRKTFTPGGHLPGTTATVGGRVERLETVEAAREATWRYGTAVDAVDLDLLGSVFTEDATLTTRRGTQDGREAIVAYYRTALADPVDRRHFLVNPRATWLEPGRARVDSLFLYTFAGPATSVLGWGAYADEVVVVDGVGYLTSKTISIDMHADPARGFATGTPA